jgi:sialate O-acetylesterase
VTFRTLVSLVGLFGVQASFADVELPRLFADHMILQQQTSNTIWGFAGPKEKVMVKASWGEEETAVANDAGQWKVYLKTPAHGTGHALTIVGKNTINIKDVAIGEVWLCAGQSNMGWALGQTFGGEKEAASIDLPNYRIYKSQREHWHHPLEKSKDRLAKWQPCNPTSAAETSAVSYYFGKKLHQELDVPVGIIVQAFAGTPIEGWMPWGIQQDDPRAQEHKRLLDEGTARLTAKNPNLAQQSLTAYAKELAAYNAAIDAGETMKNSVKKLAPPIITKPSNIGHQYPSHIFNAMIYPVRPYGIRGAIWYQGERNAKNVPQAFHYRNQLAKLINYYRSTWHEMSGGNVADDFPFQFTQLPSYNPAQTKPVEGLEASWAVSRESMLRVTQNVPNTGMAVSIDTGDAIMLHPKNKKPIGLRHAYVALAQTYGKDVVGYGPRYRSHEVRQSRVILHFDSVGSGLMAARKGQLDSFAVAGADKVWHWGNARIRENTVVVSCPEVEKPVAVRYAWAMNPSERNLLYNQEGIPGSPFRTDDWPLYEEDAEIVDVFKPQKPEGYEDKDWVRPTMTQ